MPAFQRQLNQMPDGNTNTANPTNESMSRRFSSFKSPTLVIGTIIKMGIGTYDALVEVENQPDLECICASSLLPALPVLVGASQAIVFAEGSRVIVAMISQMRGVILCVYPDEIINDEYSTSGVVNHYQLLSESGVNKHTEKAYEEKNIVMADNNRPMDLMPGDITWLNEFMVGMGILKLVTFIQASERAKIELFMLDDEVRMTSGHFQHFSSAFLYNIYNDNGFNTDEFIGSHHQCEMFGCQTYKEPLLVEDKANEEQNTNTNLKHKNDAEDPYILGRYQFYLGHMGGLFSFFIVNPEPKNPVKLSEEVRDEGLFHTFIDGSGRLFLRTAGGICLQRTDKIAVPKKIAQPWYTGEGPGEIEEKLPFEWNIDHPYARHLQLRDAFAWYTKNSYQRFLDNRKNYFLPESDEDLKELRDQYDKIDEDKYGKEKFSDKKHKDATSYFHMDQDGSITIRGKSGEEICLKGGNIVISCPGNIEVRSGKSTVVLGGHDTIIKGKKSVDITASDNDVRIKAQKNLHLYSKRGMLLESDSESDTQTYEDKEGEEIESNGIVLKAAKSRVFMWGKQIHLTFIEKGIIEAFKQGVGAVLSIIVPRLQVFAKGGGAFIKTENAALQLTNNQASLVANSAYLSGSSSSGVFKGSKYLVPIQEAPVELNPHEMVMTSLKRIDEVVNNDDYLGESYTLTNRDKIKFVFRPDKQYGTDKPSEVYGATKFVIYETSWAFLKKTANSPFIEGEPIGWEEEPINDTYPWPGKDCYDGECLIELETEENIEDNKIREYNDLNPMSGNLKPKNLHSLTVMDV